MKRRFRRRSNRRNGIESVEGQGKLASRHIGRQGRDKFPKILSNRSLAKFKTRKELTKTLSYPKKTWRKP